MLKKLAGLLFVVTVVCSLFASGFAKDSDKKGGDKQDRVEGAVVRTSTSTITVRDRGTGTEKTVHYDESTKWGSQYHGSKKVNMIEPKEVKDGDQVICLGSYDNKGQFHATDISKRLSHSPK
jgi:hypothetical protein